MVYHSSIDCTPKSSNFLCCDCNGGSNLAQIAGNSGTKCSTGICENRKEFGCTEYFGKIHVAGNSDRIARTNCLTPVCGDSDTRTRIPTVE